MKLLDHDVFWVCVCSSGLLSTCILGKAEHMLAIWQGHVDIIADTHASSTYQRIQINSLFGRISASALDTRRRGGEVYREAFPASPSLQEEGATETCYQNVAIGACECRSIAKTEKEPLWVTCSPGIQQNHFRKFCRSFEWTSYKYAGNVCWRKMKHIFSPRHSIYLDIYVFALIFSIIFSISFWIISTILTAIAGKYINKACFWHFDIWKLFSFICTNITIFIYQYLIFSYKYFY